MIRAKFGDYHVNSITNRPLHEQADEISRECDVRRRIYDRWVAEGKLSWTEANDRLERLLSALRTIIKAEAVLEQTTLAAEQAEQTRKDLGDVPLQFPVEPTAVKDTHEQKTVDEKKMVV